jgi:uncharacterized protein YegJ (DUF2314 family)
MSWILLLAFAAFAIFALRRLLAVLRAHRTGSEIDPSDPAFAEAERRARALVPQFLARFQSPRPGDSDFMAKIRLHGGDMPEQIWVEELARQAGRFSGVLANHPMTRGHRLGDRVAFDQADILDWGFMERGVMQGHYSTRLFMERMPEAAAADVRRQFGW